MLDLKRIFAGVLAVCLLSGCTAREQDQELLEQSLNTPFETTAHLQYQGVDARMTIQGDGAARSYTLSFTEPLRWQMWRWCSPRTRSPCSTRICRYL